MNSLPKPFYWCLSATFLVCQIFGHAADGAGKIGNLISHDGANVEIHSAFSRAPKYGFMPVICLLDNPTPKAVEFTLGNQRQTYSARSQFENQFTLSNPAGASRQNLSLMVPIGNPSQWVNDSSLQHYDYNDFWGYFTLSRASTREQTSFSLSQQSQAQSRDVHVEQHPVLVCPNLAEKIQDSRFKPAEMAVLIHTNAYAPSDWRAYAGFRALAMNANDWREMPGAARTAIGAWVQSGGHLMVLAKDPASDGAALALPGQGGNNGRWGKGRISLYADQNILINALTDVAPQNAPLGLYEAITNAYRGDSFYAWTAANSELTKNTSSFRTQAFVLGAVACFALLIGPINFFWIAPRAKRHRLFFSIPALSLGFGLLLVTIIFFIDGTGGKGKRFLLVENCPGSDGYANHIMQHQVSKCGALFSTGFTSPGKLMITPVAVKRKSSYYGEESGGTFSLKSGEEAQETTVADGTWFHSRSAQAYLINTIQPTRGRIEMRGSGATAQILSSFDFAIDEAWIFDGTQWWKTGALNQGTATAATLASAEEAEKSLQTYMREAPKEQAKILAQLKDRPNHYVAFSRKPQAIETHREIRWETQAVITGPILRP